LSTLDKIKQLEEQLAALRKEVENKPAERDEWPVDGAVYWFVSSDGELMKVYGYDEVEDHFRKISSNIFKTEEEAEAYKQYLMKPSTAARAKLQMWADKNNEDFEEEYYYFYSQGSDSLTVSQDVGDFEGTIQFSSEEVAEKAIVELGRKLIKTALGVYD